MKMGWRRSRPPPRCRGVVVAGIRQSCHPRSGFVHHCPRRGRYSDSWWPPQSGGVAAEEEEEDGDEEEAADAALLIPPSVSLEITPVFFCPRRDDRPRCRVTSWRVPRRSPCKLL